MKRNLPLIASAAIIMAMAPSCGVLNKNKSATTQSGTSVTAPATRPATSAISSEALAGEWTVYTVGGNKVTGENRPYINFSMNEHRMYGSNGCNIINGDFELKGGDRLTITNMISTMMMCPDAPYEQAINLALEAVQSFEIDKKGHEYYLQLRDSRDNVLMTLRKHNMDFLNGSWEVTEINDISCDNPDMQLVIDIQEKKLHGNTGCNIVNGSLLIDPDKSNSIQFQDLATTRMACPENIMKGETAMLVALESVEYAKKGKANTIIMLDKDNKPVIVLHKLDVER